MWSSLKLVTVAGDAASSKWFDVGDLTEDAPGNLEGLDASATHVANLLSNEPADVKLGVVGFSMGAAAALYSATCYSVGKYSDENLYTTNLSAVIGPSGWLPCAKVLGRRIQSVDNAAKCESCHLLADLAVSWKRLGHYTIPNEIDDLCAWLTLKLGLGNGHSSSLKTMPTFFSFWSCKKYRQKYSLMG